MTMDFASAIYEGEVRHRRYTEHAHDFSYNLFLVCLDLDEIEAVCARSPFWSATRFAPAWFRRADFLPGRVGTLREAVLEELREKGRDVTGIGEVRVLTHLRYWGLSFNPLSIFYCYDRDGVTLRHLLLEVHNTPWNERHVYVLDAAVPEKSGFFETTHAKDFHVSPFLPMDMHYRFRFNAPGDSLAFHMENLRRGDKAFDATLTLQRRDISASALNRVLLRYPWMTAKVLAGIYWQALRLLLKGVKFRPHPGAATKTPASRPSVKRVTPLNPD